MLTKNNRKHLEIVAIDKSLPSLKETFLILQTFSLTAFAWIFFRAENLHHAFSYIKTIFSSSIINPPEIFPKIIILFILILISIEWIGRKGQYGFDALTLKFNRPVRWSIYAFFIFTIGMYMATKESEFIYFQF